MLTETVAAANGLTESAWIEWKLPPEDYFEMLAPDAFSVVREAVCATGTTRCAIPHRTGLAAILTFELNEQMVGWPMFEIDAPAGTVVELLVHEAHKIGGPPIMNSHFHSWSRFICKEGLNRFETFDFESFRWMQLHVRNHGRAVTVSNVGIRRRQLPWPSAPHIRVDDARVQKVIDASINTMVNCAQETIVDGMARERQQYSGDASHQLHTLYSSFGETRLPGRFVTTFGQGLTLAGFFFDCWPAYDRLARTMERQLDLTQWGPILDHSVGFCFECWYYHLYTGRLDALRETFPRLLVFFNYLQTIRSKDGLIPVQDLGLPMVWIDHEAYRQQRDKQCAFNLYIAAMCEHALAPLCEAFSQTPQAQAVRSFGAEVKAAVVRTFWSKADQCFVNNLPWLPFDKEPRFCDRSLATSVLFDQCPRGAVDAVREKLKHMPPDTGRSYPANAIWRYWALAKLGEVDVIISELGTRWREMESVGENNTLQEFWHAEKDSNAQWSHCAVAPLIIMHMGIAGVVPTSPGYRTCDIRPQPGALRKGDVLTQTIKGPISVALTGARGSRVMNLSLPADVEARLIFPAGQKLSLPLDRVGDGKVAYRIKGPTKLRVELQAL